MSNIPNQQLAVIQSTVKSLSSDLPIAVSPVAPVPKIDDPFQVLVRVLAVGLNPTDYKMVTHFFMEGNTIGCDLCGIIEEAGESAVLSKGTRVCGADFPYRPNNPANGAFQQYAVADSRHLLLPPQKWSDTQAAGLGAIGWATACLALADPEALGLTGSPSRPNDKPCHILIYGGATATGLVAIQLLKESGYAPIAICSAQSSALVRQFGAIGTASYTSSDCLEQVRALTQGAPVKHALDCITDEDSVRVCYGVLSRTGGKYACLEDFPEAWRTRRAVKVKVVMGFEGQGYDVDLNHPVYSRKSNPRLHALVVTWAREVQNLLNSGKLSTQPIKELDPSFGGVIEGLRILQSGQAGGRKLVARIPT